MTWTSSSKTEAFSKVRELFNSGKIELYPHPKAIQQIKNLIVTYRSSGLWSVSGGTGVAVDDYASVLGAIALVAHKNRPTATLPPSPIQPNSPAALRAIFDPEYKKKLRKQNPWMNW